MSTQQYRDLEPKVDRWWYGDEVRCGTGEWYPVQKRYFGDVIMAGNGRRPIQNSIPEPATPQPVTAASVLQHAAELLVERAKQRDQPTGERSIELTVKLFNLLRGRNLTTAEGCEFMCLLKKVRGWTGDSYDTDSHEDEAAFVALKAEERAKESI